MTRIRSGLAAVVATGALLLAACGSTPASTPTAPAVTATAATGTWTAPATATATQTATAATPTPSATATATPGSGATYAFGGPAPGVVFPDAQHGWALVDCGSAAAGKSPIPGDACRLVATSDGGQTWTSVATGLPAGANLQFLDDHTGFATIQGGGCVQGTCPGFVFSTTDGGKTWTKAYIGALQLTSMDYAAASAAWAVVNGALESSADGGASWRAVSAPACKLDFVRFVSANNGLAGGGSAQGPCLITTSDGGATWQAAPTAAALAPALSAFKANLDGTLASQWQNGAQCSAADERLAGDGTDWLYLNCDPFSPGALLVARRAPGAATWQLAWGINACLMGCHSDGGGEEPLFYINGTTAWRAAPTGEARTTDGGQTWQTGASICPQGSACPASLAFVTANHGWAVTREGLFTTTDGGQTWSKQWPASS